MSILYIRCLTQLCTLGAWKGVNVYNTYQGKMYVGADAIVENNQIHCACCRARDFEGG